MNDEFLYRLRKEPPAGFALRLKAKLDRQARQSRCGSRTFAVRAFVATFLLGSCALAATLLTIREVPFVVREFFGGTEAVSGAPRAPAAATPASNGNASQSRLYSSAYASHERSGSQAMPGGDRPGAAQNGAGGSQQQAGSSAVTSPPAGGFLGAAATRAKEYSLIVVNSSTTAALTAPILMFATGNARVESVGTVAVIRTFCKGAGTQLPDIAVASGRMTAAELAACSRNGVRNIVEAKAGYQAVVITGAQMGIPMKLSARDIYTALAQHLPDPADPERTIANPYRTWNQVNPQLDDRRIEVAGPAMDSVLGQAFAGIVLEAGCDAYPSIKALKEVNTQRYERMCHTLRDDGTYVKAQETDILVTQRLWADPSSLAVLSYDFYRRNSDKLIGSLIEGGEPSMEAIAAGKYPAARPLYLYLHAKNASYNRYAQSFLDAFLTERGAARLGYSGSFIALSEQERRAILKDVQQLKVLKDSSWR